MNYTSYTNLTDDELLTICDNYYANELIVELRERLEKKIDELETYERGGT